MARTLDVQSSTAGLSTDETSMAQRAENHLRRMLYFRRQYDQRRSFFYRQYIGQQDRRYFPDNVTPRSSTFVMYPFSNVETIVSRVDDAFFSFDPWFECKGRTMAEDSKAEPMGLTLDYKLDRAKLKPHFLEFVRNVAIYGHAGFKVDWDWGYDVAINPNPQFQMQNVLNPQTGQLEPQPVVDPQSGQPIVTGFKPSEVKVPRMCPKFTAIDVYDLLVDPDGGLIAHMADKTWGQLQKEQEQSLEVAKQDPTGTAQPLYAPEGFEELAAALNNEPEAEQIIVRIAELWNEIDGTVTIITFGIDSEAISWKDLRASFRQASYSGYRRKLYGGGAILLYHGPIPFAHKRAPILTTSFIKLPNETFGLGAIEIISDMTESMNRFVNMIADNWNMGINRRYAYNTDVDIDHAALNMFNTPGGKVGVVGNPNDAIMPLPFFTPQRGDYAVLDVYKGMIEMTSGVSDFYAKGVGDPTNNKTASGIAGVINETNFRFKMFIRSLEVDVLQPMLQMCASMIQQYVTSAEEVRVTHAAPGIDKWPLVTPEELIGNFDFELVAANYATNKVVRQRNLLAFANWASNSPFWNQEGALEEFAKVFEIRNYYKLIKPAQQVQQEQAQAQASQAQMMLLEKLLDTESKAIVAELARKSGDQGGLDAATKHAMEVQQFVEDFLERVGGVPVEHMTPPPVPGHGEDKPQGRPRGMQQEGKIPGAGHTSAMRSLGQEQGANGLGMGGNGEAGMTR